MIELPNFPHTRNRYEDLENATNSISPKMRVRYLLTLGLWFLDAAKPRTHSKYCLLIPSWDTLRSSLLRFVYLFIFFFFVSCTVDLRRKAGMPTERTRVIIPAGLAVCFSLLPLAFPRHRPLPNRSNNRRTRLSNPECHRPSGTAVQPHRRRWLLHLLRSFIFKCFH